MDINYLALFIKILIIAVTLLSFYLKNTNTKLSLILIIYSVNIIVTDVFIAYGVSYKLNNNLCIIITNFLWLLLVAKFLSDKLKYIGLGMFLSTLVYTLSTVQIFCKFLNYFFVYSALIFLISYCTLLILKLHKEELSFFTTSEFILISAPLLFFIGKCLVFAFKIHKKNIFNEILFLDVTAWRFIDFLVNIIMYGLIVFYLFRNKNLKNV